MIRTELQIINKRGLHARAAAKLAGKASQFASSIRLGNSSEMADGRRKRSVMRLATRKATSLHVEIRAEVANAAPTDLTDRLARRLDEKKYTSAQQQYAYK